MQQEMESSSQFPHSKDESQFCHHDIDNNNEFNDNNIVSPSQNCDTEDEMQQEYNHETEDESQSSRYQNEMLEKIQKPNVIKQYIDDERTNVTNQDILYLIQTQIIMMLNAVSLLSAFDLKRGNFF